MITRHSRIVGFGALALIGISALSIAGCLDRELRPLNPCLVSGVSGKVQVKNVDKVDLLMMVDNSNSMAGEQSSLRAQFPSVIKVLTTGFRSPDDPNPFPPVKDLHVGVVSCDMGIPGVELPPSCHADGGDDGKLQNTPHGATCDAMYPLWLQFIGDPKIGAVTNPDKFANDVACIANLGTGGCGFEQQLEAPFKALMPRLLTDAAGNVIQNPYRFIATEEARTWGRGDMPVAQGGNAGFIRNALTQGLSLIAILVVTDEEDCSVKSTDHLKPNNQLPETGPGSEYRMEDINLRCFNHKEFLYDLKTRYLTGFQALRPGNESLVVFAAITGVPPDLVDQNVLSHVDFDDQGQRDAFYSNILNDSRMQEEVDPTTMPGSGQGNLKPSCVRAVAGDPQPSTAFPPRRIVELAQMFGPNGIVQSICQDDFGPAMGAIINIIAKQLGEVCLPRPLVRQANGLVPCNVVWELPAQKPPGAPTPLRCEELPFLGPVDPGRATTNTGGGMNCKVAQIPVTNFDATTAPAGEGWFYDNFTDDLKKTCKPNQLQRVAFTADAKPPTGVTVKLECLNETQKLANTRLDLNKAVEQPEIGTNCGGEIGTTKIKGDAACVVTLENGMEDHTMFCHPELNVCERSCTSDAVCPPAWVCDTRPDTLAATKGKGAYCVNPTCGADTTTK